MNRLAIVLAASSLFVGACALPDLPVLVDAGSDSNAVAQGGGESSTVAQGGSDSSTSDDSAAPAVESSIGEQPDADATTMGAMDSTMSAIDSTMGAIDSTMGATDSTMGATDAPMVAVGPDSPTCTNACTLGLTQCAVGVVQT